MNLCSSQLSVCRNHQRDIDWPTIACSSASHILAMRSVIISCRGGERWSWRATLLQSLAPTLKNPGIIPVCIKKTLISCFRCVWLGLELNSTLSEKICKICTFRGTLACHWGSTLKGTPVVPFHMGTYLYPRSMYLSKANMYLCWLNCTL